MTDKVYVAGEVVKVENFDSKAGKAMQTIVVLNDDSAVKTMGMLPLRHAGQTYTGEIQKGDLVTLLVDADVDRSGRGLSYFVASIDNHARDGKDLLKEQSKVRAVS